MCTTKSICCKHVYMRVINFFLNYIFGMLNYTQFYRNYKRIIFFFRMKIRLIVWTGFKKMISSIRTYDTTFKKTWSVFASENVNQLNVDDDKNKNRIAVATNLHIDIRYMVYMLYYKDSLYGNEQVGATTNIYMYCWRYVFLLHFSVFHTHVTQTFVHGSRPENLCELHSLVL